MPYALCITLIVTISLLVFYDLVSFVVYGSPPNVDCSMEAMRWISIYIYILVIAVTPSFTSCHSVRYVYDSYLKFGLSTYCRMFKILQRRTVITNVKIQL